MAQARAHVLIAGYVQGVFFRANTREMADFYKLTGWAKNTQAGEVEAVFEGDEENIKSMIQWCHKGPDGAGVKEVEVKWEKPTGEFKIFHIRY